jgi:arogenate dehydrogenase (NADP+)
MKPSLGIIGFGRFGQFLAKHLKNDFNIYVTSRTNYQMEALALNIIYLEEKDFYQKNDFEYLILATSILSTSDVIEKIVKSYPNFLNQQLLIDVLSVKLLPSILFFKLGNLYPNLDLLLTHPMFGPDSASESWENKKFVFYRQKISNKIRCNYFLNSIKEKKCQLIELSPEEHDKLTSNSQFLTHLIGRILEKTNPSHNIIETDGFNSLLKLVNQTKNDSWDLFEGLYHQNPFSNQVLNQIISSTFDIKEQLNPFQPQPSKIMMLFEKLSKMDLEKNLSVGIPSWYPTSFPEIKNEDNIYAPSLGLNSLRKKLKSFLEENHQLDFTNRELVMTCGGKASIFTTIKTLGIPGKKWLIFKPYWNSFKDMIELEYQNLIELDYYDRKSLIKNLQDKDVLGLILVRPNNPDNNNYLETLEEIVELIKINNKYLIADEVYLPLTNLSSIGKFNYEKILIIGSFSKAWGLTGWRVGYLIFPKDLLTHIKAVITNIFNSPGHYAMKVAEYQLENYLIPKEILKEKKEKIFQEIFKFLPNIRELEKYSKSQGMYLYIKGNDKIFLENKIGVASSEIFKEEGYVRITIN